MQPTSTTRWPARGSRPVVSVSRTISRMRLFSSLFAAGLRKAGCVFLLPRIGRPETAMPALERRHRSGERRARRRQAEPGRDDDVGLAALEYVGHLLAQD